MAETNEPEDTVKEDPKASTRIILRMEKGNRTLQLDESALLAWMLPAFLAGAGVTLLVLREFGKMKHFEIPGLVALIFAKTSSKIWNRRFKTELHDGEAPGCGPIANLIGSALFLPLSYYLVRGGSGSLVTWLIVIGNVSSLLDALAELLFPYRPQSRHAPTEGLILLPFPEPVIPRDSATQDSESRSGFRFLILAVIVTLAVLIYLWRSQT